MNIVAIIQARVGSSRFPGKVFSQFCEKPMLWHIVNRVSFSKIINNIVLATTINQLDDEIVKWARVNNISFFRGSESDVLERYYYAAKEFNADVIVRITSDDPFKDPQIIDKVIEMLIENELDFACNNNPPSFPEGLDTEVFTFESLEKAHLNSTDVFEREHVTQYFYRNPDLFSQLNYINDINYSNYRWTVDTLNDYSFANKIYNLLYRDGTIFLFKDIINLLLSNPELSDINSNEERSVMYKRKKV